MSDLIEFLEARIGEDEEAAREFCVVLLTRELEEGPEPFAFEAPGGSGDPVRVLVECAAKRGILKLLALAEGDVDHVRAIASEYQSIAAAESTRDALFYVVRSLTLPYTSHPDYDLTWKD